MERRDWSLKALEELNFIDSLDDDERAEGLRRWTANYLAIDGMQSLSLNAVQLNRFAELMQKNIYFLKQHKDNIKAQIDQSRAIRKFLH